MDATVLDDYVHSAPLLSSKAGSMRSMASAINAMIAEISVRSSPRLNRGSGSPFDAAWAGGAVDVTGQP